MPDEPRDADGRTRLRSALKRGAGVAVLVAVLAAIASSEVLHRFLLQAFGAAEAIIQGYPVLGMSAFVAFAALSALLAFFSSAMLVPVAIVTWGETTSMLLLWLGWLLGGMCTYAAGRGLGRPVVRVLAPHGALERFETRISSRAPFGLVLLFQMALPSEVPGYVLGLLRYNFPRYLLALAIAELPFAIGTVYLGESFLERRTLTLVAVGAAGAAFSVCAFYLLQKRLSA